MAREKAHPNGDESYVAGADLTGAQYTFVKEGTTLSAQGQKTVTQVTAVTDRAVGILQNAPPLGGAAQVRRLGKSKLKTDGTANGGIAVGSVVGSDASGRGVNTTTADRPVYGRADAPSGAAGVVITLDLDAPLRVFRTPA